MDINRKDLSIHLLALSSMCECGNIRISCCNDFPAFILSTQLAFCCLFSLTTVNRSVLCTPGLLVEQTNTIIHTIPCLYITSVWNILMLKAEIVHGNCLL